MKRRKPPPGPIVARTPSTPQGEARPKVPGLTSTALEEFRARGEKVGYDPYNASEPIKSATRPQRPRR